MLGSKSNSTAVERDQRPTAGEPPRPSSRRGICRPAWRRGRTEQRWSCIRSGRQPHLFHGSPLGSSPAAFPRARTDRHSIKLSPQAALFRVHDSTRGHLSVLRYRLAILLARSWCYRADSERRRRRLRPARRDAWDASSSISSENRASQVSVSPCLAHGEMQLSVLDRRQRLLPRSDLSCRHENRDR